MKGTIFIAMLLLGVTNLSAQIPDLDIGVSKAYCNAPDTLTLILEGLDLTGTYNYVTNQTTCNSPELIGTVDIMRDPINKNKYFISDFSFGLFRSCYDIDPPGGNLSWEYSNSLLTWTGADNYGDSYEFETFESTTKSWIFTFTNTYDDFATVILTRNDGIELPYATIDPNEVVNTNYAIEWNTGEVTQSILITQGGIYEVTVTDDFGNTSSTVVSTAKSNDPHPDFEALSEFFTNTDGDNWVNNSGWKESIENSEECNPCKEWFGVSCENGRVTNLVLEHNNLSGEFPVSLTNLSELKVLNLFDNNLSGNIPPQIANLQKLISIYLTTNQLSGSIPNELFLLPTLGTINLTNNFLTGELPKTIESDFLFNLSVSGNNLSGELPDYIGTISLNRLALSYNNFEGQVPDNPLGPSTFGFFLSLEGNNFSGPLPEIDSSSFISILSFANNNFSGEIPDAYFKIENRQMSLKNNNLSGELPSTFPNKETLEILEVSGNNLTGNIPSYINELPSAVLIDLSNNNFSGCLPELENICALGYSDSDTLISFNNGNTYEFASVIGYDFTNNPLLPWTGDFTQLCEGENPIGASCDDNDPNTSNDAIQDDCSCDMSTSTHDLNGQVVTISPNPSIGFLKLNTDNNKNLNAKLYNPNGQYIKALYFNAMNDLTALPKGIYFVEIINSVNYKKVVEKLVIE